MSQVIEKTCRVCGRDVSNLKRTKDAAGNYYCQPCYERTRTEAGTAPNQVMDSTASAGTVAAPYAPSQSSSPSRSGRIAASKATSNRSLLIGLVAAAVVAIATFLIYFKLYMAPIHDSLVSQDKSDTPSSSTPQVSVTRDPNASFEAFVATVYKQFYTDFNGKALNFDGPVAITTYSFPDTYSINLHKSQSETTPYVGTLTINYTYVDQSRSGVIDEQRHDSGTVTIVSQNGKWMISDVSSLFPYKLETGVRDIAKGISQP